MQRRTYTNPTTAGDQRLNYGQGRPMAKSSSSGGSAWYLGTQSQPQAFPQGTVESRLAFDGTVSSTNMSLVTDARELGRIGIFGTGFSFEGGSPRLTSESLGRDINPLGRGDGLGYVGGMQKLGALMPSLPLSTALEGQGNSVNNPCGSSCSLDRSFGISKKGDHAADLIKDSYLSVFMSRVELERADLDFEDKSDYAYVVLDLETSLPAISIVIPGIPKPKPCKVCLSERKEWDETLCWTQVCEFVNFPPSITYLDCGRKRKARETSFIATYTGMGSDCIDACRATAKAMKRLNPERHYACHSDGSILDQTEFWDLCVDTPSCSANNPAPCSSTRCHVQCGSKGNRHWSGGKIKC